MLCVLKSYNESSQGNEMSKEREPVGVVCTVGGYPDDSEHGVNWLCAYKDIKDGDLLYVSPPKPLSGKEISVGFKADEHVTNAESYWAGVEYAEHAHGIGD
jgi:hypothetical protein